MRKLGIIAALTVAVLLFAGSAGAWETATGDAYEMLTGTYACETAPVFANKDTLPVAAESVLLVERETGTVLYEDNADAPHAIASITKVMTMILVMEAIEEGRIGLEDLVTTSEHAYSMGGSQIWLEPGETMTVDQMLRAVAVASANDAAVALAEHVAGSEEAFVALMNQKAQALGMSNTTFKNANGLDEEGHLSCARDVAIMSREVLRHELVRNYVTFWRDELRGGETQLTNTNKMLKSFNGITGLKTGTTNKAGVCISASAERDGMELIAVVLGSPDSKSRFSAASSLLEYGFANYELAPIAVDPARLAPVDVKFGVEESCAVYYEIPSCIVVEKGKADTVSAEVTLSPDVTAPVEEGQVLGEIAVYCDGAPLDTYPLTASCAVERLEFGSGLRKLLDAVITM